MNRRAFVTGLGAVLAVPTAGEGAAEFRELVHQKDVESLQVKSFSVSWVDGNDT